MLTCAPNGLRCLRVGERGLFLGAGKNSKREKCLKMPQNPTRQVHALLAGVYGGSVSFSDKESIDGSAHKIPTMTMPATGTNRYNNCHALFPLS